MRYYFLIYFLITSLQLFPQEKPVVVLELFTSQGCSSCPPADRILNELKDTKYSNSIIPIAYHVDYWNYIGWIDPFSQKKFTVKQRNYGHKFKSNSVYTPQLIINGNEHIVGSDGKTLLKRLKKILNTTAFNTIDLDNVVKKNQTISFSYDVNGPLVSAELVILLAIDKRITKVKRGENRDRTLINSNIVVQEHTISLTEKEGKADIKIPDIVLNDDLLRLIVLIRDKNLSILTGAQLKL